MDAGHMITIAFGVAFIGAGLYAHSHLGRFLATAREASGTVTAIVYANPVRQTGAHPVLQYRTAEGREAEGRSWQAYSAQVGDRLTLLYDPADPAHVEIGTRAAQRRMQLAVTTACIALGIVTCLIGLGLGLGILDWKAPARR